MEEAKVMVTEVKDTKDVPEVRTYRLTFVGAVLDGEEVKQIRKIVNTPPIAIDKTIIVCMDDSFFAADKEEKHAQARDITEGLLRAGGMYENVLFVPKGCQFMRAVEI